VSASGPATGYIPARSENGRDLKAAFAAARSRTGLTLVLAALAALAWFSTVERMAGMDAGPGTPLGSPGWFLGAWVVMMGAMMLPALAPTTALYARMTRAHGLSRALLFDAGYLVVWAAVGLLAYGLFEVGRTAFGADLAWRAGGRWMTGAVLALAAVYEVTPLKNLCLGKCRSPLGFLLGSWREGNSGAVQMGARHAGWCLGCCWALMAGLFALGIMSLTWMAVTAALITIEKTLPWRRPATWGTACVLMALAVAVVVAPHSVPGLVVPGGAHHAIHVMHGMG
jgi:predicted metal-binding membrane protein